MTLAAVTKIRDVPVVFGDILISQCVPRGRPFAIPTRKDVAELMPAGYYAADLRRKVAVVHDRLAVAWADSQLGAKVIIGDLRKLVREHPDFDRDRLFAFLDAPHGLGHGVRCQLVGWLVDDRGPVAFRWDLPGDVNAWGDEWVIGSGAADFTANAAQRDFFYTDPTMTPEQQVTHIVLVLAANAVGREVLGGEPLRKAYGGALEVAVFLDGRFKVVTDLAFLSWSGEIDIEGKALQLNFAPTILKYMTLDDCLVVLTTRIDRSGNLEGLAIQVVTPVDKEESEVFLSEPLRFVSKPSAFYCNFIAAEIRGHGSLFASLVLQEPNDFLRFNHTVRDGKIEAELDMRRDFPDLLYKLLVPQVTTLLSNTKGR
jgi:hypothetical protein